MTELTDLNILNIILMAGISLIPIFLVFKTTGNIKKILIILSIFTIIHGVYHVVDYLAFEFLADSIFRPISVAVLIVFGICAYFMTRRKTMRGGQIKH